MVWEILKDDYKLKNFKMKKQVSRTLVKAKITF